MQQRNQFVIDLVEHVAAAASSTAAVHRPSASAAPVVSGAVSVATGPLGSYLVDKSGKAIYILTSDKPNGASACTVGCLKAWPPIAAPTPLPSGLTGITATFGTSSAADGSSELTINGYPAYNFIKDTGPGHDRWSGSGQFWRHLVAGDSDRFVDHHGGRAHVELGRIVGVGIGGTATEHSEVTAPIRRLPPLPAVALCALPAVPISTPRMPLPMITRPRTCGTRESTSNGQPGKPIAVMPPYSMPVSSVASASGANDAFRAASRCRTDPFTSSRVVASSRPAA